MKTVTIGEAKRNLAQLIDEVLEGEEVLIAPYRRKPVVKLMKVDAEDLHRLAMTPSANASNDR
jgi:antitoxin (DNA-binding transcriptional repressor) of toxin-antitoxin stability system